MPRDPDNLAKSFETENTGGFLTGFLAEEDNFDRRSLWRLGSWGAASVGAVIVALLANQSSIGWRRDHVAAADLARQSQQIQSVAKESQNETLRLASAIDTLNGDRDRLYSRVTVLEQGLDLVTGAIARQNAAPAPPQAVPSASPQAAPSASPQAAPLASAPAEAQSSAPKNPAPAPVVTPVATTVAAPAEKSQAEVKLPEPVPAVVSSVAPAVPTTPAATPATPLVASKSIMAPPDPAAGKLIEPEARPKAIVASPMPEVVASTSPAEEAEADAAAATSPKVAVQRTEFAVDVGGANSVGGLRALWRGLLKSRSNAALTTLHPVIVVRESTSGLGMQLRLVAGPISDAAAAAKICATMLASQRPCETTVFDGQRLAMKADDTPASAQPASEPASGKPAAVKPASAKPAAHRRSIAKRVVVDEPPKQPEPSTLSSFFSRR